MGRLQELTIPDIWLGNPGGAQEVISSDQIVELIVLQTAMVESIYLQTARCTCSTDSNIRILSTKRGDSWYDTDVQRRKIQQDRDAHSP